MTKRALWLLSNKVITEADVPALLSQGYEVYTVKKACWSNRSDGLWITDRYDATLSISQELKGKLDQQLFMGDTPVELWEEINANFDLAFIDYYAEQFEDWIDHFRGKTICRLTHVPAAGSLGLQLAEDYGLQIFSKIDRMLSRFWFAPIFPELADREAQIIRRYFVPLPPLLQEPESYDAPKYEAQKRICVICPEIKVRTEQEALYKSAMSMLETGKKSRLPYQVCGKQYLRCEFDPNIVGDLPEKQLLLLFRASACALYLQPSWGAGDFQVFTALRCGLPLLVSADSDLAGYLFSEGSPAVFHTKEQAQQLMKKLLEGDDSLRAGILKAQNAFFSKHFGRELNAPVFAAGLRHIEESNIFATHKVFEKPRVAVILMDRYSEFTVLQAQTLIQRLKEQLGEKVSLCLGIPDDGKYEEHPEVLKNWEEQGLPIRSYEYSERDERWLSDMLNMKGYPVFRTKLPCYVLDDHNTCFEDCRLLILLPNRRESVIGKMDPIISSSPYAIYMPDFDETETPRKKKASKPEKKAEKETRSWKERRRKKEEKDKKEAEDEPVEPKPGLQLLRGAHLLLLPGETTRDIAVYRNGAPLRRTRLIEPLYAALPEEDESRLPANTDPFFLYFVDLNSKESLRKAESVLTEYYLRNGQKDVVLAGENGTTGLRIQRRKGAWLTQTVQERPYLWERYQGLDLSIPAFCSLMRRASFAVLPQNSDLFSQLAFWLLQAHVPFAAIDASSTLQLAAQFSGRIFDLRDGGEARLLDALLSECRAEAAQDGAAVLDEEQLPLDRILNGELGLI